MTSTRISSTILSILALSVSLSAFAGTIYEAAKTGDAREVGKMISANSRLLNAKNELGSTPLHVSSGNLSPDVATLLIEKGAVVNVKDNNGATPLHLAAFAGRKETINLLLARGADIFAKDAHGKTARDYADMVLNREVADMLLIKMLAAPTAAPIKEKKK